MLDIWCRLYMDGLYLKQTTTMRDLTVPSVSSLPLSIMVRSRAFISVELVH